MAGVMEVLTQSGAIPLEELKLRTGLLKRSDVHKRVFELAKQGLVAVKNPAEGAVVIDPDAFREHGEGALGESDYVVELTTKGLRNALRGNLG